MQKKRKNMKQHDPVQEALNNVTENSEMTIEERFDDLGQVIIANAYAILSRIRETGVKIDPDEEYRQEETVRQFKVIASTMKILRSNGRITNKVNEHFDEQLLKKIKDKKGTIGNIVVDIPKS